MKKMFKYFLIFTVCLESSLLADNIELFRIQPDSTAWVLSSEKLSIQTKYFTRNDSVNLGDNPVIIAVLHIFLRNDLRVPVRQVEISPDYGLRITKLNPDGTITPWRKTQVNSSAQWQDLAPNEIVSYDMYIQKKDAQFFKSGRLSLIVDMMNLQNKSRYAVTYSLPNIDIQN